MRIASRDHYPWSHSLLALVAWGVALALIYFAWRKDKAGAVAIWIGVTSHWALVTHHADLPLYPGGQNFGLALSNSIVGPYLVELGIFFRACGSMRGRQGRATGLGDTAWGVRGVFAGRLYRGSLQRTAREYQGSGVDRPDRVAVLLVWAWWFDRHRDAVFASAGGR